MLNTFKDICEVSYPNLQKPLAVRGRSEPRTLKRMEEQHKMFQEEGKGDLANAKDHMNVIRAFATLLLFAYFPCTVESTAS